MNNKALIVVIILSFFLAAGMTTGTHEKLGPEITIETNKTQYNPGETVGITYTNIGDAIAGFVIGTARPVFLQIIEVKTGKVLLLSDPNLCYPCVMMYGILKPGENINIKWDQQYYGYFNDVEFSPSKQVPDGLYYIELGYWEVIGDYNPPYHVPGGPSDYHVKSKIFTIGEIGDIEGELSIKYR